MVYQFNLWMEWGWKGSLHEFTVAYRIPMDSMDLKRGCLVPPAQAERFVHLHGEQNSIAPHQWSVRSSPGAIIAPVGRSGSRIGDQRTMVYWCLLMSTVCVSGRSDLPVVLLRDPNLCFRRTIPCRVSASKFTRDGSLPRTRIVREISDHFQIQPTHSPNQLTTRWCRPITSWFINGIELVRSIYP